MTKAELIEEVRRLKNQLRSCRSWKTRRGNEAKKLRSVLIEAIASDLNHQNQATKEVDYLVRQRTKLSRQIDRLIRDGIDLEDLKPKLEYLEKYTQALENNRPHHKSFTETFKRIYIIDQENTNMRYALRLIDRHSSGCCKFCGHESSHYRGCVMGIPLQDSETPESTFEPR